MWNGPFNPYRTGEYGQLVYTLGSFDDQPATLETFSVGTHTEDATPTLLASKVGVNYLPIPSNTTYTVKGIVTARANSTGASSSWEIIGTLTRAGAANTTVWTGGIGKVVDTTDTTWTLVAGADTTNGGLALQARGQAALEINWSGPLWVSRLTGS